LLIIFKLCLKS